MWSQKETLIFRKPSNFVKRKRLCAFDLDHTLVKQKSGKKFPTDENDWVQLYPNIKEKLIQLSNEYTLVIFSNQNGIKKGKVDKQSFQQRVDNFLKFCNLDIWCFAATDDDYYRKPGLGMWEEMLNQTELDTNQLDHLIYVGDAAGRIKNWKVGAKKDFSCSDRKFAYNIGIFFGKDVEFSTPEEFFKGETLSDKLWVWNTFDSSLIDQNLFGNYNSNIFLKSKEQSMIILVGPPASGKSTISKKVFSDYLRINRDTLKTPKKCLSCAERALNKGLSVIIDNTNPSCESRKPYLNLAKKFNVPVKCIIIDVSKELANHLNNVRVQVTKGKAKKIPMVSYHVYYKKFEPPTLGEGFDKVSFEKMLPPFDQENEKKLFNFKY